MGYLVECEKKIVWNPSAFVGNYFLTNIKILEQLISADSGINSALPDSIYIDKEKLSEFVAKLFHYIECTNNTALFAMVSGFVEIVIALNYKINETYPESTKRTKCLIDKAKKIFFQIDDYQRSDLS